MWIIYYVGCEVKPSFDFIYDLHDPESYLHITVFSGEKTKDWFVIFKSNFKINAVA